MTEHLTGRCECGAVEYRVADALRYAANCQLREEPRIRPSEHIFVGSTAPWFEITDDLPQNTEYRGNAYWNAWA
jgi:hypothetical protein